jgi:hypothetical protein
MKSDAAVLYLDKLLSVTAQNLMAWFRLNQLWKSEYGLTESERFDVTLAFTVVV